MADAESRRDEDNILAQLLPGTTGAVSSQGFVEEDEEEVKYSDTDEDFQPIDSPGRRRREPSHRGQAQGERSPPGADQGPAQKKHAAISWHEWQGPGERDSSRAERATRENGLERRRQRDSADGGMHSGRDGREQRSSRRSPARSRGTEGSREWRERILRKAAAETGGSAAAISGRRSSREGSRGISERQQEPRSGGRHRSADNPRRGRSSKSQSRDFVGATTAGDRRGEVMNPRIGPAGPRELEETEGEAVLRRARKKESMWDVDTPMEIDTAGEKEKKSMWDVERPTPLDNGPRTRPLDGGALRQRSWTPPGPPQIPLPPPPAFEDHHSLMRRSRESTSPPPRRYVHVDYPPAPRGPPPRSPPYYYPLSDRGRSPPRGWPSPPCNYGGPHPDREPYRRDARDLPPPPGRHTDWERTADMRRHPSPLEPRLHPSHYMERAPYGAPGRERRLSPPPPPQWRPRELLPARSSPRRRDSPPRRVRAASPRTASPAYIDSRLSLRPERSAAERRGAQERGAERHERSRRDSPSRLAPRREQAERNPEPRAAAAQPESATERGALRHERSKRDSPSRLAPRREPAGSKPEPRAAAAQPGSGSGRKSAPERDAQRHERSKRDSPSRLAPRREPAVREAEPRNSPSRLASSEIKLEPRAPAAQPSSLQVSSSKAPEVARRPKQDAHSGPESADKDGSSWAAPALSEHKAAASTADKAPHASGGSSASKEAGAEQAVVPSKAGQACGDGPNSEDRRDRGGQHGKQRSPSANVTADRDAAPRRDSGPEGSGRKRHEEADTAAQNNKKTRISTSAPARSGRASDAAAHGRPSKGTAATPSQQRPSQEDAHRSHDARKAGSSAAASREDSKAERRDGLRAEQPGNAGPVSPSGTWGRYSATVVGSASAAPSSAAPCDMQPKPTEGMIPDAAAAGKERGHDPSRQLPRDVKSKDGAASTRKGQEGADKNESKPLADRGSYGRDKQKRESSKREREELHEDRGTFRASKRHAADSAAATDRKVSHAANGNAHKSTNGHSHAADRDVKSNGGAALPGPPPLPVSMLAHSAGRSALKPAALDEGRMEWFYLDPKGETQGPCSMADFKKWLGAMRVNANLRREYEEFLKCWVWRKGDKANRSRLARLLG